MNTTPGKPKLDTPCRERIRDGVLQRRPFHLFSPMPFWRLIYIASLPLPIVRILPQWLYLNVLECGARVIFSKTCGLRESGEMSIYTPFSGRNGSDNTLALIPPTLSSPSSLVQGLEDSISTRYRTRGYHSQLPISRRSESARLTPSLRGITSLVRSAREPETPGLLESQQKCSASETTRCSTIRYR